MLFEKVHLLLQPKWEHLNLVFLEPQNLVALAPLSAKVRITYYAISFTKKNVSFSIFLS